MKQYFFLATLCMLLSACSPANLTEDKLAGSDSASSSDDIVLTEDGVSMDDNVEEQVDIGTGSSALLPMMDVSAEGQLMQMKNEEVARLTEAVLELKKERDSLLLTMSAIERDPLSDKDVKDRTAGKEVSFKSCGLRGLFEGRDWFDSLTSLAEMRRFQLFGVDNMVLIDPSSIEAGCYSDIGDIFIFIVPGDESGKGFALMRYDVKMDSLQVARMAVAGKNTIAIPHQFGKRDGNTIGLSGTVQDGACQSEMNYSYDFIENVLSLKQACVRCAGQDDACEEW